MLKHCKYKALLISTTIISIVITSIADKAYALNLGKNNTLRIHGFLSQGYLKSDNNHFFGNSDQKGSLDYNELGLNASYAPSEKLNFAGQLLSRRAGKTDDGDIQVDFALLDFRLINKSNYNFGTRVGRIKNPFGFYNDTRDVSFTRESIIIPQSIYFERTRDISISSDGVEIYIQRNFTLGSATLQFLVAQPRVKNLNTKLALFRQDQPGDLEPKPSFITRLAFHPFSSAFKLAYSNIRLHAAFEPDSGGSNDINFTSNIFSLNYAYQSINFTAEYALRTTEFAAVNKKQTGQSYYLQLTQHLSHRWNIFSRYDVLYQNKNDKNGKKYALSSTSAPAHSRFAKDLTVGAQFIYSKSWMFRLEAHYVNGTAWLSSRDNPDLMDTTQKWRLLSLLVAYRF